MLVFNQSPKVDQSQSFGVRVLKVDTFPAQKTAEELAAMRRNALLFDLDAYMANAEALHAYVIVHGPLKF